MQGRGRKRTRGGLPPKVPSYEHAGRLIDEIGRMVGGWLKGEGRG